MQFNKNVILLCKKTQLCCLIAILQSDLLRRCVYTKLLAYVLILHITRNDKKHFRFLLQRFGGQNVTVGQKGLCPLSSRSVIIFLLANRRGRKTERSQCFCTQLAPEYVSPQTKRHELQSQQENKRHLIVVCLLLENELEFFDVVTAPEKIYLSRNISLF